MRTIKKISTGFQEIFLIWFVVSLIAVAASAQPNSLVSTDTAFKPGSVSRAVDTSLNFALTGDPKKAFARESFMRSFINKGIFPGVSDPESSLDHLLLRRMLTQSEIEAINFSNGAVGEMSVTQDRAMRLVAKDQTYKIAVNMLSSIEPVSRLQKALEPYTRLIELYRDKDGAISSNYLGQTNSNAAGSVRVFIINLGVSSSDNLNVMATIYDRFTVSLLNGDKLITQYLIPKTSSAIGLETNARSKMLFRYSIEF